MADLIEIKVPDIGDFDAVEIIELLYCNPETCRRPHDVCDRVTAMALRP